MATKKPRISVSVSPEAKAALDRFSEVSGVASSSFISSIVDDAIPIIDAMTKAYETARNSPRKAVGIMETEFLRTMSNAAQAKLDFDDAVAQTKLRKTPRKPKGD